ncbi:MAG: zinc transporter ZntB [Gammaproteobacteria bacterium]|nr:zinc transporter ZntB [Gammaproteobacteria bacterium]MDH4315222.1 zinc transporter ZntB [Gammaproteobacteria bacterium]MDH5215002.1 zinc transporter ZntB [Gammaproteobacteria bacterium]MDH5500555.1 zinc transporter ZntB [Gammaproteobacteria bacterium]
MSGETLPVEFACVFDGKGGARTLSAAELAAWQPDDGILWVDINLTLDRSRDWLVEEGGADIAALDILLAGETRPRFLSTDNGLVLVIRAVNLHPGADPEDMVAVRMWVSKDRIITSRRRRVLSVDDIGRALLKGEGPRSSGGFVVEAIETTTDRIGTVVDDIGDEMDDLDSRTGSDDVILLRQDLADLRRQVASVRRFLAPQRDALDRVYRLPGGFLSNEDALQLREEADRLTRYVEDLDLAREHALVIQEEMLNRVAQEQNQRIYLLSVVAAIFLPLTFVTGLLGMNVAGLPGTASPYGFTVSVVVMIFLGIGLIMLFKMKKWI